jgi:hypothetical protein
MKNLRCRLEALERNINSCEIALTMEDGATQPVRARRLVPMLKEVLTHGTLSADTQAVLRAVSDDCEAMGGGHLTELMRVLHAAKLEAAQSSSNHGSKA